METKIDYWVYIIRCADGSYYIGSTQDLEKRLRAHEEGRAATYTARRRPLKLAYSEKHGTMDAARGRELQIKGWIRKKKEALISGNMEDLKSMGKKRVS
jgi:predicted GIY-YIG superfamily endonuclease